MGMNENEINQLCEDLARYSWLAGVETDPAAAFEYQTLGGEVLDILVKESMANGQAFGGRVVDHFRAIQLGVG